MSVIVPAFNEEAFIGETLVSLLEELDRIPLHGEIIVVDDASSDETAVRALGVGDHRIRVLRNAENQGRGRSRNAAIAAANGEYLAIHDADDLALPGRIQVPLHMLLRDEDAVGASGQAICRSSFGFRWRVGAYPTDPLQIAADLETGRSSFCHGASVLRRSAVLSVGGYGSSVRGQDLDLLRRLSQQGGRLIATDRDLIVYRHPILLRWSYWAATRRTEQALGLTRSRSAVHMWIRFLGSNVRRVLQAMRTLGSAPRLSSGVADE